MRVPARFHNGEWTETDNWMEAHPIWTNFLATIVLINLFLSIAVAVEAYYFVFHP